jgi:hypothetical protein
VKKTASTKAPSKAAPKAQQKGPVFMAPPQEDDDPPPQNN